MLKAGLVNEQQLRDVRTGKRRQRQGGRRPPPDAAAAAATSAQDRRREADRERNRRIEVEREKKVLRRRIRDLVVAASLNAAAAERPYAFPHGKRIKRLYVTPEQSLELAAGRLAITVAGARHHLVPLAVAEQVRELSAEHFVYRADPDAPVVESDDPYYAAFAVPDDLEW